MASLPFDSLASINFIKTERRRRVRQEATLAQTGGGKHYPRRLKWNY